MKKFLDLKLFVLVAILTVALVFVGVDFIESQVKTQGKPDKPDKPDKPSKPSETEWIEFTGDLVGAQEVTGCCPNAGPTPPYRMCLNFPVYNVPPTCHNGNLFINFFGAGKNQEYLVKFGFTYEEVYYCIKIVGGVIDYNKKTKVLTVTFTDELCVDNNTGAIITEVSFTLVRYPI